MDCGDECGREGDDGNEGDYVVMIGSIEWRRRGGLRHRDLGGKAGEFRGLRGGKSRLHVGTFFVLFFSLRVNFTLRVFDFLPRWLSYFFPFNDLFGINLSFFSP